MTRVCLFFSSLGVMEITGLAFLWHQVRCMAAILLLVGLKHEQPEVLVRYSDTVPSLLSW